MVCGVGVGATGGVGIDGKTCSDKPSSVDSPFPRFLPCLRQG